jgi:hypothetical protein
MKNYKNDIFRKTKKFDGKVYRPISRLVHSKSEAEELVTFYRSKGDSARYTEVKDPYYTYFGKKKAYMVWIRGN